MNFNQSIILTFLVSLVPGLLTACGPVHRVNSEKQFYGPHEKHISGHLYRNGRYIHHHPERYYLAKQEKDTSEQKEHEEIDSRQ